MSKDSMRDRATASINSGVLKDLRQAFGEDASDSGSSNEPTTLGIVSRGSNRRTTPIRSPRFPAAQRAGGRISHR